MIPVYHFVLKSSSKVANILSQLTDFYEPITTTFLYSLFAQQLTLRLQM